VLTGKRVEAAAALKTQLSALHERTELAAKLLGIAGTAFPHRKNGPARGFEPFEVRGISGPCPRYLRSPIVLIGLRATSSSRTAVPMPIAAMNKHYFFPPSEDDVRLSGKLGRVQAESIAHAVQKPTYDEFRSSILAPNLLHQR